MPNADQRIAETAMGLSTRARESSKQPTPWPLPASRRASWSYIT